MEALQVAYKIHPLLITFEAPSLAPLRLGPLVLQNPRPKSKQTMEPDPWADATSSQASPTTRRSEEAAAESTPPKPRPSRLTPRRLVAQPTRLEAVEDDPLGPLGGAAAGGVSGLPLESPPVPPLKEQLPVRTTMPQPAAARRPGPLDPNRIDDEEDEQPRVSTPRAPPPVQAALPSPVRSSTQPSMSIEQAAKPSFHITVGDPHKVGDLTSSHIVYSVRTKVSDPQISTANPFALPFYEEV